MPEKKSTPRERTEQDVTPVVAMAHQSAVRMVAYEGRTFWNATAVYLQFAFLLIAAGVFPSFIGTDEPQLISVGGLLASLLGVLLTVLWYALASRVRKYQRYWIFSARELERSLPSHLQMFIRGEVLSLGDNVRVDNEHMRFTTTERVRMNWAVPVLYGTFFIAFLCLSILNFIRVVRAF